MAVKPVRSLNVTVTRRRSAADGGASVTRPPPWSRQRAHQLASLHRAHECATAFPTHSHRIPPRSRADPSTSLNGPAHLAVGLGHRSVTLRASPGRTATVAATVTVLFDAVLVRCLGSRPTTRPALRQRRRSKRPTAGFGSLFRRRWASWRTSASCSTRRRAAPADADHVRARRASPHAPARVSLLSRPVGGVRQHLLAALRLGGPDMDISGLRTSSSCPTGCPG